VYCHCAHRKEKKKKTKEVVKKVSNRDGEGRKDKDIVERRSRRFEGFECLLGPSG